MPIATRKTEKKLVTCLVEDCGAKKRSLGAHLRLKHGMSADEYRERYQTHNIGYTWAEANRDPDRNETWHENDDVVDTMTEGERDLYAARYKVMWEGSNEDPVLSSTIHQVVMNEIFIRRYQLQIQKLFRIPNTPTKQIEDLHKLVDSMQKQNLSMLTSLNLTKEKRDSLNKSPETTPSRMVTALALVCANMTPTEAARNKKDIQSAMDRLREHTDELLQQAVTSEVGGVVETIEVE